ncbi:HNH endonuclease [bacterium]|nr:HNH endonuclease [bacterium]
MRAHSYREELRRRYNRRCGYCTIREEDYGGQLNTDHYRPISRGGTNERDNLVYCCTRCNQYKGDFWPTAEDLAAGHRILHTHQDDLTLHFREETDGRLTGLTVTGQFHIHKLRLNRPGLIALRVRRRKMAQLRQLLEELTQQHRRLYERIRHLRTEQRVELENEAILLDTILETIRRVLGDIMEESNSPLE